MSTMWLETHAVQQLYSFIVYQGCGDTKKSSAARDPCCTMTLQFHCVSRTYDSVETQGHLQCRHRPMLYNNWSCLLAPVAAG